MTYQPSNNGTPQDGVSAQEFLGLLERFGGIGYWHIDLLTDAIFWSDEVCRIHGCEPGYTPASISGAIERYHEDERDLIKDELARSMETGNPFDFKVRLMIGATEYRWVEVYGQARIDQTGKPVAIFGTIRDIHDSVVANARQLAAAEFYERIMAGINGMKDAFVIFDADDRLFVCNDAYRELYSRSREMMNPGIGFEELIRFGVEQGQYVDAVGCEEEWIEERMRLHREPAGPIEQRLADGRWVRVHEFVTVDGSRVGFRIDITETKKLEARLTEAAKDAHSANRLKDRFLANMSHELRTPLNAIIGFSQVIEMMAQQNEAGDEKIAEYAADISGAGLHLMGIIEDIFSLAQMDDEETTLNLVHLEVHSILDDTRSLTGALARQHGKTVRFDEGNLSTVQLVADKTKVMQVLVNLVTNAIKYSGDSDVMVRAELGSSNQIVFKIIDEGPGIPIHLQTRIFDRFERLDATKMAIEGVGIGLAIAKDLITAMDGEIGVISAEGQGSTFWITLPLAEARKRQLAV